MIEQTNYIKQHFLQGVMFKISLVLISILRINHKRHFIKIPFINKGMEYIDLHGIFKDNLVISSIPDNFNFCLFDLILYVPSTIFHL